MVELPECALCIAAEGWDGNPATSIISEMRRHVVGVGMGVMEDTRQAFEVCHAARHLGAFFGLVAAICLGNGLCVGGGRDENSTSCPHLPEGPIL